MTFFPSIICRIVQNDESLTAQSINSKFCTLINPSSDIVLLFPVKILGQEGFSYRIVSPNCVC